MIVNPGSRVRRRVRRRRPGGASGAVRVRRITPLRKKAKKKLGTKRRKAPIKKRGKTMARSKVRRRKVRARRKTRSNPKRRTKASRRTAALKGIRRTKAKKTTRKKRRAPARRKRRNPTGSKTRFASMTRAKIVAQAKEYGVKASGTTAQIRARVIAKRRRKASGLRKAGAHGVAPKKRSRKAAKKKSTTKKKRRSSRRVMGTESRSARMVLSRNKNRPGKAARQRRGAARTYMRARSFAQRAKRGSLAPGAAKLAKSYGLTRINPSIKSVLKNWQMMLPLGAVAGGALLGTVWAGYQISAQLGKVGFIQGVDSKIRNVIPGISALAVTTAVYAILRQAKSGKVNQLAGPVMLGGAAASVLLLVMQTKIGQKLMAKAGVSIAAVPAQATPGGTEVVAANGGAAAGLGAYLTVQKYMGGLGAFQEMEISPKGASWYGRADINPLSGAYPPGGYGDCNSLGAYDGYVASDFPIHRPGPGDNSYVQAQLGDYVDSGPTEAFGAASLELPDYDLTQTPGGTTIDGGLFDGDVSI